MPYVKRLNHAVLYVRDLERAVAFYRDVFGFDVVDRWRDRMAFMRAKHSANHHDLGLASVGKDAPSPAQGSVGLYHLAWEVDDIRDLVPVYDALRQRGALTGASNHGATKSVYGVDPDGNESEVMWMVPREHWGEYEHQAISEPLQLEAELARWAS
jgi:catechol-2,3-dioxygenase